MSVLAGFDVVIELAQPIVQELVISELRLGGQSLRPPAEIERTVVVSVGTASVAATLHALLTSAVVDVGTPFGDTSVTLSIEFSDASIEIGPLVACALDGRISIEVPLVLSGTSQRRIVADLAQASTVLQFTAGAAGRLAAVFGSAVNQLRAAMEQALQDQVRATGSVALGPTFAVDNSQEGALGPPPRFTAADLMCLYSADRSQQRLCLLAMLRQAAPGNPTSKTDGLPPGCALAVHASASIVHGIICDSLTAVLGATPPGSCGGAPVAFAGATIDGVADVLIDGAVNLIVSASTSGFCYSAHGTVPLTLSPAIVNGQLRFTVAKGTVSARVDVPFYCTIVAFVVNLLAGIGVLIADGLADGTAVAMVTRLGDGLPRQIAIPTPTPGLLGINSVLRTAQVTATELTLGSAVTLPADYPSTPFVGTSVKSVLVKAETVAENDGASICDDVRIHAVEQRRWYEEQITVESRLHGRPLSVTWDLECPDTGDFVTLVGANGVAEISVVATYETTLGTSAVPRKASVTWDVSPHGVVLQLRNDAADGSFVLDAKAHVTNCSGTLQTVLVARVSFQGHVTEVTAPGLRECLAEMVGRLIEIAPPFPWPPVEGPTLGPEVFDFVTRLGASDDEEIHKAVEGMSVALPSMLRGALTARKNTAAYD